MSKFKKPQNRSSDDILKEALMVQVAFDLTLPGAAKRLLAAGLSQREVDHEIRNGHSLAIRVTMAKRELDLGEAQAWVRKHAPISSIDAVRLAQPPETGSSTGRLRAIDRVRAAPDGEIMSALINHRRPVRPVHDGAASIFAFTTPLAA